MLKLVELFGGIGAIRKSLINLNIRHQVVHYVEADETAVISYNAMYGDSWSPMDIREFSMAEKVDLLFHGSPCTDFSLAGERKGGVKGSGTQSSLLYETIRVLDELGENRPTVVMWENVQSVLHKNHIDVFNSYLEAMEQLGYKTTYEKIDAKQVGIPQTRNRVFAVSILQKDIESEYLFDIKEKELLDVMDFILKEPQDDMYTVTSPSMLRAVELPPSAPFRERLIPIKDYVWTISRNQNRAPNAGVVPIGDGKYRFLTERECWRLMGFTDDDFDKASNMAYKTKLRNKALYSQAGNSIVVQVLEELVRGLVVQNILKVSMAGENAKYKRLSDEELKAIRQGLYSIENIGEVVSDLSLEISKELDIRERQWGNLWLGQAEHF